MNIAELLQSLSQQNIELWIEEDKLRFRAPKGALSPEQRMLLKQHKAEILTHLQQEKASTPAEAAIPPVTTSSIPRRVQQTPVPLSYIQEGIWYTEQFQPGLATYNIPLAFRLRGPLDISALEQSLAYLIKRHETLRTAFTLIEGKPQQIIHSTVNFALKSLDLRHLPAEDA